MHHILQDFSTSSFHICLILHLNRKTWSWKNLELSPNQSKYLQHRVRLQEFQSLSSHICPKAQSELINLQILNVATPTVPAPVLQLSRPRVLVAKSDWLVHCDVIVSRVFIKVIFCIRLWYIKVLPKLNLIPEF